MTLRLWDLSEPPPRRLKVLDIQAGMFLHMLRSLDGFVRIQTKGIPADARVVGITTDATFNTVQLYVESESFPEQSEGAPPERLDVDFTMYTGDAYPEREAVSA